jgi:hypothetical protein
MRPKLLPRKAVVPATANPKQAQVFTAYRDRLDHLERNLCESLIRRSKLE